MKVMVIGQGGREHALVKALSQSVKVSEIHVLPGNPGMAREAIVHDINWKETDKLIHLCLQLNVDFVIIGPEDPLVDGLADRLRERGILVVGPGAEGAQLEGSKIYSKKFMEKAGVPTAKWTEVSSVEACLAAAPNYTPPFVLKADGLAAGKGVFICKDLQELELKAKAIFEERILGAAGSRALLEEYKSGWELSLLVLTDGKNYQPLPMAQDHKRLKDQDEGPNTGGMGTLAPMDVDQSLYKKIIEEIVEPSVKLIKEESMVYRGVLFIGIMVTAEGPQVLEYNVRFGDPEAQVVLPLFDGDWGSVLKSLAEGSLQELHWKKISAACVVMAAAGYPENSKKGQSISGDMDYSENSSYFIHSGTSKNEKGRWVTGGGRVLGAVGLGTNPREALAKAYAQSERVQWEGLQKRSDIGAKALAGHN